MYALFGEQDFQDIEVAPVPILMTDLRNAQDVMWIGPTLERAQAMGTISATEATTWFADLESASRARRYFAAGFGFTVGGRRPQ